MNDDDRRIFRDTVLVMVASVILLAIIHIIYLVMR